MSLLEEGEINMVVAIDGTAASGKSSASRRVAAELGFRFVNSGLIYRAIAWAAIERGIYANDPVAIVASLPGFEIDAEMTDLEMIVRVGRREMGAELKSSAVNAAVSLIARAPEIRHWAVATLRDIGSRGDCVFEGRDIGTAVFPDTPCKFFLDASPEIRQQRRAAEGGGDCVESRDARDRTREHAPLVAAADATIVDTGKLTLEEVVAFICGALRTRMPMNLR